MLKLIALLVAAALAVVHLGLNPRFSRDQGATLDPKSRLYWRVELVEPGVQPDDWELADAWARRLSSREGASWRLPRLAELVEVLDAGLLDEAVERSPDDLEEMIFIWSSEALNDKAWAATDRLGGPRYTLIEPSTILLSKRLGHYGEPCSKPGCCDAMSWRYARVAVWEP